MYDSSHRANASQSSHVHDTQTEGGLHKHIKLYTGDYREWPNLRPMENIESMRRWSKCQKLCCVAGLVGAKRTIPGL